MTSQLINLNFSTDIFANITNKLSSFVSVAENFLYETNNIHILAVILIAILMLLTFFITLFLVLRTALWIFRIKMSSSNTLESTAKSNEHNGVEQELESELQEELESRTEYYHTPEESDIPQNERAEFLDPIKQEPIQTQYKQNTEELSVKKRDDDFIPLDWKKKEHYPQEIEKIQPVHKPLNLKRNIDDLMGMIINMIGRNVDDLKISQAIMFRCKEDMSEESVMQLVYSVKEFLNLCRKGAFDNVRRIKDLPTDEDCILHLIAGDSSYAMALLEALMDSRINRAVNSKNTVQRREIFKEASNYACCFGTLAEYNDLNLSSASFELAIEMCPENALAWSRCADIYKRMGMEEKANWAYKNVLALSDNSKISQQQANAYKFLSQYMYDNGDNQQASKLYNQSKAFYDSIGINRPLDRKELEIIELLDNSKAENIVNSVLYKRQNTNSL